MAGVACIQLIIAVLTGYINETQSTWQGGSGEVNPVTAWNNTFYSSASVNWFSQTENLTLDYREDLPERVIDAFAGAPYSVVAVNMDSDTDMDLLVTSFNYDLVAWYMNNSPGNPWTCIEVAEEFSGANSAGAIDINNDGFIDIVATAFFDDSLYWFESDSSEYLWIPHPIAEVHGPGEVIPFLVSGQPRLLVSETETGSLYIFKCSVQPDTVFWNSYKIPGSFPGVESVDLADIDLDGDLDIVLAEYNNSRITVLECITWYTEFQTQTVDASIPHPCSVQFGNVDGDNLPDIVACGFDDNAVYWYNNTGSGWIKETVADSLWGASGAVICDITQNDDDWFNIVASGCYDGEVRWYEHGCEDQWFEYKLGDLPGATALCVADLDTIPGIEIAAAAGTGDAVKYWSPGCFSSSGSLTSAILDGEVGRYWVEIGWISELPAESTLAVQVRGSNDWENMGNWSEELYEPTALSVILPDTTRYFQYRVLMNSADSTQTPVLSEITLSWEDVAVEETGEVVLPEQSLRIISPNPAEGSICFSATGFQHSKIHLMDLSGRVVEEFAVSASGTCVFTTRKLVTGLYFLQTDSYNIDVHRVMVIN